MCGMSDATQAPAGELAVVLRPLGAHILVKQDPYKERLASGLYRPKGLRDGYENFGTIQALGSKAAIDAKVGDRVFFRRRPGSALLPDGREGDPRGWSELLRLTADEILAVIED